MIAISKLSCQGEEGVGYMRAEKYVCVTVCVAEAAVEEDLS